MEFIIEIIVLVCSGFSLRIIFDETLDFIPEWINKLSDRSKYKAIGLGLEKLNHLITCSKCLAGQSALIYSLINSYDFNRSYSLIAITIFTTYITQKIIDKWEI